MNSIHEINLGPTIPLNTPINTPTSESQQKTTPIPNHQPKQPTKSLFGRMVSWICRGNKGPPIEELEQDFNRELSKARDRIERQQFLGELSVDQQKEKQELFENTRNVVDSFLEGVQEVIAKPEELKSFFNDILPKDILENDGFFKSCLESEIFKLDTTKSEIIKTTSSGAFLIYKSKMINKAEKLCQELIEKIPVEQPVPEKLNNWKLSIEKQKKALKESSKIFGLSATKTILSVSKTLYKKFPIAALASSGKNITSSLGLSAGSLGIILSSIFLRKTEKDVATYSDWKNAFTEKLDQNRLGFIDVLDSSITAGKSTKETTQGKLLAFQITKTQKSTQELIKKRERAKKLKVKELVEKWKGMEAQEFTEFVEKLKKYKEKIPEIKNHNAIASKLKLANYGVKNLNIEELKAIGSTASGEMTHQEQLRTTEAYDSAMEALNRAKKENINELLEMHPEINNLLNLYVDHLETLEITTKSALRQMIKNKHELEHTFMRFKLWKSRIKFAVLTASVIATTVLTIFGMAGLPIAAASVIFLAFSLKGYIADFSLFLTGSVITLKYRKNAYSWAHWRNELALEPKYLMRTFYELKGASLRTKRDALADVVNKVLNSNEDPSKALTDWGKARDAFVNSEDKLEHSKKNIEQIEQTLRETAWKDFSLYADLPSPEDTFKTLDELQTHLGELADCNFSSIDQDTQDFLKIQLNLDLKTIGKDHNKISETIKNFHTRQDDDLISWIKNQNAVYRPEQ
jgi:hypothetical protein